MALLMETSKGWTRPVQSGGTIAGAVFVFRNIDETFFSFSEVDERRQYQKWNGPYLCD